MYFKIKRKEQKNLMDLKKDTSIYPQNVEGIDKTFTETIVHFKKRGLTFVYFPDGTKISMKLRKGDIDNIYVAYALAVQRKKFGTYKAFTDYVDSINCKDFNKSFIKEELKNEDYIHKADYTDKEFIEKGAELLKKIDLKIKEENFIKDKQLGFPINSVFAKHATINISADLKDFKRYQKYILTILKAFPNAKWCGGKEPLSCFNETWKAVFSCPEYSELLPKGFIIYSYTDNVYVDFAYDLNSSNIDLDF